MGLFPLHGNVVLLPHEADWTTGQFGKRQAGQMRYAFWGLPKTNGPHSGKCGPFVFNVNLARKERSGRLASAAAHLLGIEGDAQVLLLRRRRRREHFGADDRIDR